MESLLDEGISALRARDFARAAELLGQAAEADPDDVKARLALGAALAELGRWEEAVQTLRQATVLAPAASSTHYNLGKALEGAGRVEAAREAYRQAVRLDPSHEQAGAALRRLVDTPLVEEPAWPTIDEATAASGAATAEPAAPEAPKAYTPYSPYGSGGAGIPKDVSAPPPPQSRFQVPAAGALPPPGVGTAGAAGAVGAAASAAPPSYAAPPEAAGQAPAGPQLLGHAPAETQKQAALLESTPPPPPWVDSKVPSVSALLIYATVLLVFAGIAWGVYKQFIVGGGVEQWNAGNVRHAIESAYFDIESGLSRPDAHGIRPYVPNYRKRSVSEVDILEKTQELQREKVKCRIDVEGIDVKAGEGGIDEAVASLRVTLEMSGRPPETRRGRQVWRLKEGSWQPTSWELFRPLPMYFGRPRYGA